MPLLKLENIGYSSPNGGNVHIVDGVAPTELRCGRYGLGFGPLRLTPFAESTTVIDNLRYSVPEDDGLWPLATGAGITGAMLHYDKHDGKPIDPERTRTSRRRVLAATGAGLLALASAGRATASTDERHEVAHFDLTNSPRGLNIAVDPVVADYLPDEHTFYVSVEGSSVGRFEAGEESLTLNPGIEGNVQLESDEALSFIARLWARIRADDEVEYEFRPSVFGSNGDDDAPQSFAEFAVGEEVVLSDQPILVDPMNQADPSGAIVAMNDTTIPHTDGRNSAAGEWYVQDGRRIIYIVGEDAPDTSIVNIRINVGHLDSIRANYL